jgi:two-component system LytT family response regulator
MTEAESLRAFLVDDEPLALARLQRLLAHFPSIQIAGTSTDPAAVVETLNRAQVGTIDVLFLDIQMPGMTGFEVLSRLAVQPFVIFTTAYDQHALRAFETNAIDYLVKPIETDQLERAIKKLGRLRPIAQPDWQQSSALPEILKELTASLRETQPSYPHRIASRVGERITFLDLENVTHFYAQDKLTYAAAAGKQHCVDQTIADLERRLDPARFLRIHRSVLVNVDWIQELSTWFAGKLVVVLKDSQHTQLTVARDRVRELKMRLGISVD